MSTKPTTELDFDKIKSDIISYIKTDTAFTDYKFEGSALNAIIDILAYNTHTNAYYANMLHSEGFLDTAQKRGSIVSRAKELGYVPRSSTGSRSLINITFSNVLDDFVNLPRGTPLHTSNDNGSYTFLTVDDATSITVGNDRVLNGISVVEGTLVSNTYKVDTSSNVRSIFTIPNMNVDISTLRVFIKDTNSSIDRTQYSRAEYIYDILADDTVYYVQESYNGYFQIYFGQDIVGKQPINGNVVVIDYMVTTNKQLANGCRNFNLVASGNNVSIVTVQASYGGADKEDLDSIRRNSVNLNTTKHRAVTKNDYMSLLKQNFNFIKSASVWGGELNDPPVYGKVFISIQPVDGYYLTNSVKYDTLLPFIKDHSIITTTPEFVDPSYIDLEFETDIKFNQNKSTTSLSLINGYVKSTVSSYINEVSSFNTDYLNSDLINRILDIDSGIVSAAVRKKIGFTITPVTNLTSIFSKRLNNYIQEFTIESSVFYTSLNGIKSLVKIKEIPNSLTTNVDLSGVMQKYTKIGLYNLSNILIKQIGTVNLNKGLFDFTMYMDSYASSNRFIRIKCKSVDDDLISSYNQIFTLRPDIEDFTIGIVSNNVVNTILYAK